MTEAEWLECTDPQPMLKFLGGKASDRKVRLFACACCRRVWHLLNEEISQKGVETIERFADGEVSQEELVKVSQQAQGYGDRAYKRSQKLNPPSPDSEQAYRESQQAYAVANAAGTTDLSLDMVLIYITQCAGREIMGYERIYDPDSQQEWWQIVDANRVVHSGLLRDIVGNPFRPVAVASTWLAWNGGTIPKLAQAIYDERRFADLPILADALEEAGCTSRDILDHCRQSGEHVRGCWVVDLLLEKK